MHVLESVAKTIVFTGLIVGFAYGTEFFIAWYSHNAVEMEIFRWRAFGDYALEFWIMVICNTIGTAAVSLQEGAHIDSLVVRHLDSGQHRHVV